MNATEHEDGIAPPKKGDRFQCSECGMAIQVTQDCKCKEDEHVLFECCGMEMQPMK